MAPDAEPFARGTGRRGQEPAAVHQNRLQRSDELAREIQHTVRPAVIPDRL
jgi:hypothetical protein